MDLGAIIHIGVTVAAVAVNWGAMRAQIKALQDDVSMLKNWVIRRREP